MVIFDVKNIFLQGVQIDNSLFAQCLYVCFRLLFFLVFPSFQFDLD